MKFLEPSLYALRTYLGCLGILKCIAECLLHSGGSAHVHWRDRGSEMMKTVWSWRLLRKTVAWERGTALLGQLLVANLVAWSQNWGLGNKTTGILVIETGKGRTECVSVNADTNLVTKQFGKYPHSGEGIFSLNSRTVMIVSCRALGHVSKSGCLFTDLHKALKVRLGVNAGSPVLSVHCERPPQTGGFHQSLCGSCHVCSSAPVKALVPALPALCDYQLSSFSITLITQASKEVFMLAALLFPCIWSTGRVEWGRRNMCWLPYLPTAPEAHAGFLTSQTCGIASMASCPLSP